MLEGRDRLGGRVYSTELRPQGELPAVGVDLGANYIHGAAFEGSTQSVRTHIKVYFPSLQPRRTLTLTLISGVGTCQGTCA